MGGVGQPDRRSGRCLTPAPIRMATLSVALSCMAAPVLAQDQATPQEIDKMVAAIEAAGCIVTPQNDGEVTASSGLDRDQIMSTIFTLYQTERVVQQPDGSLKLVSPNCP